MKILIVSQYYWPESFGAGIYITEMAEGLARLGHQVEVITGFPNYPQGKIFPEYRHRILRTEGHNGVRILRGWYFPSPRNHGPIKRGLSALSFFMSSLILGTAATKPDIVMGFSPPPFMGWAGLILSSLWKIPLILSIKDLFSEAIKAAGLTQNSSLITMLEKIEKCLYIGSNHVVVNSPTFKDHLLSLGCSADHLTLIPDWADGDFITPGTNGKIREEWGLKDRFVVLYSGNMGYSSNLEDLLVAAAELRERPDLCFVLVGEGVKRPLLEEMAAEMKLQNVYFWPLQPRECLPQVLAAADVALITLTRQGAKASTQGKLYSLLAAGLPIIGIIPANSDAWAIIREGDCGWCFEPGEGRKLADLLGELPLKREKVKACGKKARSLFEARYSLKVCLDKYNQVIESFTCN